MNRRSGILMHIASLPGNFGIGTLGKKAYNFADFISKAGFRYWQILPLGHTGYGDSPYQCFSAFAGNPYFIDFEILEDEGLLNKDDYVNEDYGDNDISIDYGKIFDSKYKVLKRAYKNYKKMSLDVIKKEFEEFKNEKAFWLEDYSLYMALKYNFELKSWYEWDEDIKRRDENSIEKYKFELKDEIDYWSFLQYLFYKQWKQLKQYVNKLGIEIIGDIPIYVAADSADTWSKPENFQINDTTLDPLVVAGCPPDAFSETGQLWGNLIYNWDYMKKEKYKWWKIRVKESLSLYDVLRIDHFRGFESYWSIPFGDKTAKNGKWIKGPGIDLFNEIKNELGELNIIAEDLGFLTVDVRKFLKETGFPGMRVLQFAFDGKAENAYLPHNYCEKCIAYTGTHDNDTFLGWYQKTSSKFERERARNYLGLNEIPEGLNWGFIRGIWSSVADITIAPTQDFLNLGNEARMNLPSSLGGNWSWRVQEAQLTDDLANKIYQLNKMYGRC